MNKLYATSDNVKELQSQLRGVLIQPSDPQYDEARQAWNLTVDQHPALIVIAQSPGDVAAAVRFARGQGLGIAVQSTGHGVVRPANGCLLIITSEMREIYVDAAEQTAWVGAGAKWGMVLERTQQVGLAPLLGSSPDVGVVGYTLGGGMGWLARKYGLAADSVRFFELVTAEGRLLRASAHENPDLFWALRGGGGGFGIVTGMEIQLYPVSTVYGGNLIYPIADAKEVVTRFRTWITSLPNEMTVSVAIMNFPPLPDVPEFLRGQSVVMIRGCYSGTIEEGEALLEPWRGWRTPLVDDWKAMPFSDVGTISNDPVDPMPALSTGAWVRELSDEAIDLLIRYGVPQEGPPPLAFVEVRYAGGAIACVDAQASAYTHRNATLILQLVGMTPTPEAHQHLQAYTARLKQELQPYLTGGVYMNFVEGEESRERVRDGFAPKAYRRLVALKAQYDPDNYLGFAFNIPPAQAK